MLSLQAYHVTDAALGYFSPKQSHNLSILRLQSCWELTNHGIVNIGECDSYRPISKEKLQALTLSRTLHRIQVLQKNKNSKCSVAMVPHVKRERDREREREQIEFKIKNETIYVGKRKQFNASNSFRGGMNHIFQFLHETLARSKNLFALPMADTRQGTRTMQP